MADQRPPSFFHILTNLSSPHLPLPPVFVTRHLRNEILEDPIIKSANGGYVGSVVFSMHVYIVNGCEKILVPKTKVVDYGCIDDYDHHRHVEDDDDVHVEDDDDVHVEDDDDVEFDDDDKDDDTDEDDDVLYDVDDDDVEDEDDIDFFYDRGEDDDVHVDGDDGDPFFILTSSKSNKNKLVIFIDRISSRCFC